MKSATIGQVIIKWWRDEDNTQAASVEYLGHEYPPQEVPEDIKAAMSQRERAAVDQLASGFEILDDLERETAT